jgi:periplasmic protein TonB
VDDVGEIIASREHESFPWGTGALLALLLHGTIAFALVYSSIARPARFVSPRTVAVRLLPAGSLKGGAAPAPPLAPEPVKDKILKPAPEDAPPPPTDKAMLIPEKKDEKAPAARPSGPSSRAPDVSLPSAGDNPGGGGGGPIGAGGNVGVSGATLDDADFKYSYYIERMLVAIGMNWFKPAQAGTVSPVVHFKIEKDGTISDATVERSSGLPFVDRAALRAVLTSSPLPPLPSEYGGSQLGVHLKFE